MCPQQKGVTDNVVLSNRYDGSLVSVHVITMCVGGGQAVLILKLGARWGG